MFGNLMAPEDDDFKNCGESSAPTQEAYSDEAGGFDSDELLDKGTEVDVLNEVVDCYHNQGAVTKEILTLGEGTTKPKMGSLVKIKYLAYFYDKEIFDSSPDDGQTAVDLYIGDIKLIEGLWRGIMNMRVGEKSKIRIKKKFGFGRPGEVDKLQFPATAGVEVVEKLKSKNVIYEVELIKMVQRIDVEGNGQMFKQQYVRADRGNFERPNAETDEVTVKCELYQNKFDLFEEWQGETTPFEYNGELKKLQSPLMTKLIESVKKGERCEFTINAGFLNGTQDEDESLTDDHLISLFPSWDKSKDLFVRMELLYLVKIEDWFKDGSTIVRTLRKGGKSRHPYSDSTVKIRLRIELNDKIMFDNYPKDVEPMYGEDLKPMTPEERVAKLSDETLMSYKLDEYKVPSLLTKLIKSMKKNMVVEMTTTCLERIHTNFKSDFFDQYEVKQGDVVKFTVTLLGNETCQYFYKNKVVDKLAIVERLKAKAGDFFKQGNIKKSAKLYQKVNGYFNFGDAKNNHQNEEGEEFEKTQEKLLGLKIVCFTNLVVCKYKLQDYQTIIGITDQILEMDQDHQKALWFRALAYAKVDELSNSIQTLQKLCTLAPENNDFKKELDKVKQLKLKDQQKQNQIYSKMFS